MSEEEKNTIREQHLGGMKVMTENFSKLLNSKLGDAKPIVSEQTSGVNTNTKLTDDIKDLMKKVYLKYQPLGRQGLENNSKKDSDVLKIQKYFNSTGNLGKGQKYESLIEDGIFGGNTFWQVNNMLGAVDREWWSKHRY
jgi:hypothetical protein